VAFDVRGIQYRIGADTSAGEAGIGRVAQQLGRAGDQADRSRLAMLNFGKQGEVTARQLQALGYQTTDIVTQLASGQAAWLVLLQQGGQLRDQFGGVGNVFRAIAQTMTVTRVATLGLAGAVGLLAFAYAKGHEESEQFRKATALTGNAAGITAGDVDTLSASLANLSGNSVGKAREAVLSLAATGQFTAQSLGAIGLAALQMQRLTGESIGDITKRFAAAREGVAKWAAENNRSYNYLTAAQYSYIRQLEAQGRTQEALRVNFQALATTLDTRTTPAVSKVDLAFQGWGKQLSQVWDLIKGLGRDQTLEEKLDAIRKKIGAGEDSDNPLFKRFSLPGLRDQQAYLQEQLRMEKSGAERAARDAVENQKAIEEASKGHQDALLRIDQLGNQQRLAQQLIALDARADATERAHRQFEISAQTYRERTIAIERGRIEAEAAALRGELDIARRRVVEKPVDAIARDAEVLQVQTRIAQVEAKRAQLNRDIRDFKRAAATERVAVESPQAAFRAAELAQQGAIEAAYRDRGLEAQKAGRELVDRNAELSASLIVDEQQRGQALIALDVEQQRRRLLVLATSAEQVKAIEDELAAYQLLRERQLTEQLKPEWQKRLDLYADTTRFMKASFDEAMNATLQSSEDTWVDMITKGQFSAKRLVGVINEELARIGWRQFVAKPAADAFSMLFRLLGLGGGGGGGTGAEAVDVGVLAYHGGGIAGAAGGTRRDLRHNRDFWPLFVDEPLTFAPGSGERYANAGYVVLGMLIERLSGEDYYEYVRRRLAELGELQEGFAWERAVDGAATEPALPIGFGVDDQRREHAAGPLRARVLRRAARVQPSALRAVLVTSPETTGIELHHDAQRISAADTARIG